MRQKQTQQSNPVIPRYPLAGERTVPAPPPSEIWIPAPTQSRPRPWRRLLFWGSILMILALAVLGAVGTLFVYESPWILPRTQVLGIELGGQTRAAAEAQLTAVWESQTITLSAEDKEWRLSPGELGIILDVPATIERAHRQGRSLSSWQQLWRWGHFPVTPVWSLDPGIARQRLEALAPELAAPPLDAGIAWDGEHFVATPAQAGRELDLDTTMNALTATAGPAVRDGRFTLTTAPVPPTVTDVSDAVAAANRMRQITLELNLYDPVTDARWQWTAPPQTWGNWLSWDEAAAAAGEWEWILDREKTTAYFQEQGAALGEGRFVDGETAVAAINEALSARRHQVNLRVYHAPRQHIVQPGETLSGIGRAYGVPYPWIQAANPGVENLAVGQSLTVPSPDELIPLPVVNNKRIVVSIAEQRVQVFEDGALKWDWPASTGIADSPTAPGIFQVQTHETNAYAGNWDLWMPHFMGIYQPVPTSNFMNGFHGFPTRSGAQLLWTNSLGRPVTYGCILVSSDNAERLYNWAEAGVIVEIQP